MVGGHRQLKKPPMKFDRDKAEFDLIPAAAELEVARVFTHGANKYERDNWRGLEVTRLTSAAQRHINAWRNGRLIDPESGLLHTAHAAACLVMITELMLEENPGLTEEREVS